MTTKKKTTANTKTTRKTSVQPQSSALLMWPECVNSKAFHWEIRWNDRRGTQERQDELKNCATYSGCATLPRRQVIALYDLYKEIGKTEPFWMLDPITDNHQLFAFVEAPSMNSRSRNAFTVVELVRVEQGTILTYGV